MAEQFKQRSTKFIVPPFNYEVHVVATTDVEKSGTKLGIPPSKNYYAYHAPAENCLYSAIVLPFEAGAETIAHEAYHCVCSIMDMIGAKLEEEVVAYTLGFIVKRIDAFLKSPQQKAKRREKK